MLERAAGYLENAGRRFFRDPNGAIRGRSSIYSSVGQYTGTGAELLVFLQASQRSAANPSNAASTRGRTANDLRTPFLDFLYPPRTQDFISSSLIQSPKRLVPRRRKKGSPGLVRNYTSEAARRGRLEGQNLDHAAEDKDRELAKDDLQALLAEDGFQNYDQAWALYARAGHPLDMNSALLAGLSGSDQDTDNRRAKRLLEYIPEEKRSAHDYLQLAKSYVATGKYEEMSVLCRQAVSRGLAVGLPCWGYTFTHILNAKEWTWLREIWDIRPACVKSDLWLAIAPWMTMSLVPQSLLAFAEHLRRVKVTRKDDIVNFILHNIFLNPEFAETTSTETLLVLLQKFHNLQILNFRHYFNLIKTLQASQNRPTFVRSILIYRNFRWQMGNHHPPSSLVEAFLTRLTQFDITTGIPYFLDEFANFFKKPSVNAYKHALIGYSRAGDVAKVNEVFQRFLSDHGLPQSRRILAPVLYVHSRLGDAQETLRQFKRISHEFGLVPDTVCWNILVTAYAKSGDLDGSFVVFKQMLEQGVEASSYSFGTLMGLCANRGDIDRVHDFLDLAKQHKVQVTAPMIDTLVEAHCNKQEWDVAERVADNCLGLDVKGSRVRMWNILLWNYAFKMDLEAISRVRSRMEAAGLQPDDMTHAALMLSLVLLGQTDSARRILRTLHRGRRLFVTEFHYAIILYGYLKDRNRDMVHVVYREIQERYNQPGLGSKLLHLKSQIQRDLQLMSAEGRAGDNANVRLVNSEKFLAETIAEHHTSHLATKYPLPGSGGMPARKAFPAVYYEYIISAYGTKGASKAAQRVFDEFITTQPPQNTENEHDIAPLLLVTALMRAHLKAEQFEKVEECWNIALPRALKIANSSSPEIDNWLSERIPGHHSQPPPLPSQAALLVNAESHTETKPSILTAYRFMLSRPLSLYLRSLAYRNELSKIPQVIAKFVEAGFSMTTFNWSTAVQLLASSDAPADQIEAFTIFEDKFMPNFTDWKYIRRGFGARPADAPPSLDAMEDPNRTGPPGVLGKAARRYWSNMQPDFMQPTYVSLIYLAAALQGVRERSITEGGAEMDALYHVAPKTIAAIASMPYLREKFQGVLLRSREEQPTHSDYYGGKHAVWTGGVLGVGGEMRSGSTDEPVSESAGEDESMTEEGDDGIWEQPDTIPFSNIQMHDEWDYDRERTIDYPDEHDLEMESHLEAMSRKYGTTEEFMDVQQKATYDDNFDESEFESDNELDESEYEGEDEVDESKPAEYDGFGEAEYRNRDDPNELQDQLVIPNRRNRRKGRKH